MQGRSDPNHKILGIRPSRALPRRPQVCSGHCDGRRAPGYRCRDPAPNGKFSEKVIAYLPVDD
jgi:hypothetical protein